MRAEWLDAAALRASRRYARLASLAALAAVCLSFVNLRHPTLRLPAEPPRLVLMRFQEPLPPVQAPREEERLLANESPFTVPDTPKPDRPKEETPPPKVETPAPEPVKPRPKAPEKHRTPPKQAQAAPVAPPESPAAQAGPAVPQAPAQTTARTETPDASRQTALQLLVKEIERRKHYPKQARRTGAQGTVTLAIRIGDDGKVRSCSVARQCGIGALDQETDRLGSRLVGLDTGVRGSAFTIHVPVRYALR